MTTYFVECYRPGIPPGQLAEAVDLLDDQRVRYLVMADEIVLCVVEAQSQTEALAAASRAGLPQERVVECVQVASRATPYAKPRKGGTE